MASRPNKSLMIVAAALLLGVVIYLLTGETTQTVPNEAPERVDESSQQSEEPGELLEAPPSAVGDIDTP